MRITFLTIFPHSFDSFLGFPVIRRALENGLVDIEVVDIREYADGCFRAVDDSPYGGGPGLLLRADTLSAALAHVRTSSSKTILMGPKGRRLTQSIAHELAEEEHIILIAGHYEGVDERFRRYIDDEISIGDYILTGGESAAMVTAEAVIRLLDGTLRDGSADVESFEDGILEYPQYTHPAVFDGVAVPAVLLSGDRERIARFNEREALKDTIRLRPDLLSRDRDFIYHSLHRDYCNEAAIIRWLGERLPVPSIVHEDDPFLMLSRPMGRTLDTAGRNKILKTAATALRMLWSVDISTCPCDEGIASTIRRLKGRLLPYDAWDKLKELEACAVDEDLVFSHGSLSLCDIMVNGNGIVSFVNLQGAGKADRYRDLASLTASLEEAGISKEELIPLIGMDIDEEKLGYFRNLHEVIAQSDAHRHT